MVERLDPAELDAVTWLVEAATEADAVRPLSEHVLLHLRHGGDEGGRNVLLWAAPEHGGGLAGYGHLDLSDEVQGPSAECVVAPRHRRHGYGRALVRALVAEAPGGRLRVWAHGALPGALALARDLGLVPVRELWQMRRPLDAPLPEPAVPPGVTVRAFRPGEDDEEWLALNARVFADHPEQGSWTAEDLRRRLSEPWFDPEGFLLAERDGVLVGYHWTKVHGAGEHGHDPIGEIYVLGIAPEAQGGGLGRALALAGLRHLRRRGLSEAMLYVEGDNAPAVRVYTALGFRRSSIDVMLRAGGDTTGSAG